MRFIASMRTCQVVEYVFRLLFVPSATCSEFFDTDMLISHYYVRLLEFSRLREVSSIAVVAEIIILSFTNNTSSSP